MSEALAVQVETLEKMIESGDLSGALDFLETLSQEERAQWQIQNLTGVVCAYCRQFREAEHFFTAALAQKPDDENILYNLKDTQEALEQLKQAEEKGEEPAAETKKRVLMAAYYFPPLSGSGVFRSIKFAKYLPLYGWQPTVISTDRPPNGWNFADESQVAEIPKDMEVIRIPDGISTGRVTSLENSRVQAVLGFLRDILRLSPEADAIFAEYLQSAQGSKDLLTFPCGALCWAYDVVRYIEKNLDLSKFDAIYTTSGPSSAHLIGFYLKRKYGIAWVADYRDPWTDNPYGGYNPAIPWCKMLFELERLLLQQADCNLTVEESLVKTYMDHFGLPQEKIQCITNGYDEEDFVSLVLPEKRSDKFTITYSGLIYTKQQIVGFRAFLEAVQQLCKTKKMDRSDFCFYLAGEADRNALDLIHRFGLGDSVRKDSFQAHSNVLQCNLNSDLLLLLVGDEAKQKPVYTGKFFEYLRSGRPILALAPKGGAVARVLRETGHGEAFLSTQVGQIKAMILREYRKWQSGEPAELLHAPAIARFERKELTRQLAQTLDRVSAEKIPLPEPGSGKPVHRLPKYLVICNGGYPTEGNPRCMFAHQRVLQYIKAGFNVEAFGFIWDAPLAEYKYQGVKVTQGGAPELQKLLRSENYEKLLIHFADNGVMYAIQQAGKLKMPMIIWCHGYEILRWNAVHFNYSAQAIAQNKSAFEKNDQEKSKLFKQLFQMRNMHFIFVSNWMKERVKRSIGFLPVNYSVIPNFINRDFYQGKPRAAQERMKILSIKSHATKMYANDITARAILELSKKECFTKLEFDLYGSGLLFKENFGELKRQNFSNVHIHEVFLGPDEMKAAFAEHGILIAPTRRDTQGVTTCEAMSAGLAVISCNTSAIPEFMDEECASLYEYDNYFQLADEIEYLYYHPDEFLRKSRNAVQRVRTQCGYEATIQRELQLFQDGSLPSIGSESTVPRTFKASSNLKDNDAIIRTLPPRHRDPNESFCSREYWEARYAHGGNSGAGSYNRLAEFKAEIINDFIQKNQISSVIEWGCGDGNQLGLFLPIPYTGYDVSKTAVEICRKKYPGANKTFVCYDGSKQTVETRELALSLDVIYHLIEDEVFENYMYNLFHSSSKYICIYSNNYDLDLGGHQRNRNFTDYVSAKFPEWKQIARIKNRYPYDPKNPGQTSLADFYIYEHL